MWEWGKVVSGLIAFANTVAGMLRDAELREQGFNEALLDQYRREEVVRKGRDKYVKDLRHSVRDMSDAELDRRMQRYKK